MKFWPGSGLISKIAGKPSTIHLLVFATEVMNVITAEASAKGKQL
jgi:hypothetical protein